MTATIFKPSLDWFRKIFHEWLMGPPDSPFTVAADSKEEAVAFVACLLRQDDLPAGVCDRAVLFESADALRQLAQSSSPFIPVVSTEETERAIGDVYRRHHCIVVRPRNAVDHKPDIAIELLSHEAFETALADMGITERERVDRLARESGRSPTVLRRRLSEVPAIQTPLWAGEAVVARRLIPMTLVGTWHAGWNADREILAALAGRPYEEIEYDVADLLRYDDCSVWCVGQYRGVVSKIDALFAIAPSMTSNDIINFVDLAEYVLAESDPTLELPEDERWKAGLYGKVREHSAALRIGVCETLVLLAVHGNALFQNQIGIDNVDGWISALVRRLLTPFTSDKLLSHVHDLPNYAEAAPDAFLTLLEEDLKRSEPVLQTLLKPVGPGLFESPVRTGILWALERLAWNPRHLMRVTLILADLSRTKIDDNLVNRPINSLAAIFRSWLPQTAVPLDERITALEALCTRFPDIGWQICIQQIDGRFQTGAYSDKPRWRNDASGAGEMVRGRKRSDFVCRALDLAVAWPAHDGVTLGDLVECLNGVPPTERLRVWDTVDAWSRTETNEKVKAELRERIRRAVLTRRGHLRGLETEVRDRAREVDDRLTPRDPGTRHAWLFAESWVRESVDELRDENFDWRERDKRIRVLRTEAMTEIWSVRGLDGAIALLPESDAALDVGYYAAPCAADPHSVMEILRKCLSTDAATDEKVNGFMRGFIAALDDDTRTDVLSSSAGIDDVDQSARLFRCAPFDEQTWRLLDRQAGEVRDQYWKHVVPEVRPFTEAETTELIHRLLNVDRPSVAFSAVRFDWDKVETSQLKRLLVAVATVDSGPVGDFKIEPYRLSEALDSLNGRPGVTPDEMAQLEFAFIRALRHSKHGIPKLEQRIVESPPLFVQVLALAFRRRDGGQDPSEWCVDDPTRRAVFGSAAYELLHRIQRIPGENTQGQVDADALMRWITEARRLCREQGRLEIGDQKIGEWLSRASSADDARWPCRPVCEVLETLASEDVAKGFEIGVYTARGDHWRSLKEGGAQERDLAAKYRAWAQQWRFEYLFVGKILDMIADGYERDAAREDAEVRVRQRLEH